jgi:uncharacterized protein
MIYNKAVFGMVHLSGVNPVEKALEEIRVYEGEGVYGIIIENYHNTTDFVIKTLESLKTNLKVGINILPNEYEQAFELASKFNADFIQLDFVAGKYTQAGIDGDKYMSVRNMYSNVEVLGGVWPKYYTPVADSVLVNDLSDATKRCNAVVVTGSGTGKETPLNKIKSFKASLHNFPLIVGAGVTPENASQQLLFANGCIVGSAFKPFGNTNLPVDRRLVRRFMEEVRNLK